MAPEPSAQEQLLADTRWLHRLLVGLVGDLHAAEDLHQEALLAAWAHGSTGNVTRSWLSRVAKNLAASFHRRTNRRTRAEGSQFINNPSSAPPELIVEAELQGRAVDAVLALDEPYRTTVLLRYMKGRSLDETAVEMAVPVDTVRTRQRRALEFLREKLGVRAQRRAWLPIAWPGWAKGVGVMMMSKKSAIAAFSVLAFLAIAWSVIPLTAEVLPALAPEPSLTLEPVALGLDKLGTVVPASPSTSERSVVAAPKTGSLEVRLIWKGTSEPAVGIPLRLGRSVTTPGTISTSDSSGILRFEDIEPGSYLLRGIWLEGLMDPCDIEAGRVQRKEYALDQGLRGTVTVVDPLGNPVADALVVGARAGLIPAWRYPLGRTDSNGQFEFRGMNSVHLLGAVSETLGTSQFLLLAWEVVEGDTTRQVTLTLPGTASAISGHVYGPGGTPAKDAAVLVFHGLNRVTDNEGRSWSQPPIATTRTDVDGAFSLGGLLLEEVELIVIKEGLAIHAQRINLDKGPLTGQTVLLEEGATIEGTVTDERGQPRARLSCRAFAPSFMWWPCLASSGEDGTFRIENVPSGPCRLEITSYKFNVTWEKKLNIADGGSYLVNAVLANGERQRCRLVDSEGQPLSGWEFVAGTRNLLWDRTDEQGFFTLTMEDGHRDSLPVKINHMSGYVIHYFGPLQAQPTVLTLTVPAASMPSAWMAGRLLDSDGDPLAGVKLTITQWGTRFRDIKNWMDQSPTGADGAFRIGPLPPGRYSLAARHAKLAFPFREIALAVNEEQDIGSLRGIRAASLTLLPDASDSDTPLQLILLDENGEILRPRRSYFNKQFVFAQIFPGAYRVAVVEDDRNRVLTEVTLLPGDALELRLTK